MTERKFCFSGRVCCKCGKDLSEGQYHGRRYYNGQEEWDGKSWICDQCYNELERIKRRKIKDDRLKDKKERIKEIRCCICGRHETYVYHGIPVWFKYKDESGNWDRKSYVCKKCYNNCYQRNDPNSQNNLRKSIANIRTGNLSIYSDTGKSIIDQAVIAKVLGGKDINIEMDKFDYFIDIIQEKYGNVDVKGAILKSQEYIDTKGNILTYCRWTFPTRRKIDCGTYICLGYDSDRKNVKMVWIIPNEGWVCNLSNIDIYKTFRPSKYDKFEVDPKLYNGAYQSLLSYIGDRKYFGIKDIKKWIGIV